MARWLSHFWLAEDGQDLVEYTLLIAFIALATAALIASGLPSISGIWTSANTEIGTAGATANGS